MTPLANGMTARRTSRFGTAEPMLQIGYSAELSVNAKAYELDRKGARGQRPATSGCTRD